MSDAFRVKLMQYTYPGGTYRGRVGPIHIPRDLRGIVQGVFGLDDRRQARPQCIVRGGLKELTKGLTSMVRAVAPDGTFIPPDEAKLYDFPERLDGAGQCIGIIEFGGGYVAADFPAYFGALGLPTPSVTAVSVDRAKNRPHRVPNDEDVEVTLDVEIAGAIAPGAKIVVYFSHFTERGWVDALNAAIQDTVNKPTILSISWGFAEGALIWTQQAVDAVNQALQAAAIGMTVCAASAAGGSNDQIGDGHAHTDFPAASPFILACGGTTLTAAGTAIQREVVWNNGPRSLQGGGGTSGGISDMNPLPDWQRGIVPPSVNPDRRVGRGVPDVASDADPNTGYHILVRGRDGVVGGTSAVAPLRAGLVARINQRLGIPPGYFNPLLYKTLGPRPGLFHDITQGNNDTTGQIGGYPARPGWDACTGWDSPDGTKLLLELGGVPAHAVPAGVPASGAAGAGTTP